MNRLSLQKSCGNEPGGGRSGGQLNITELLPVWFLQKPFPGATGTKPTAAARTIYSKMKQSGQKTIKASEEMLGNFITLKKPQSNHLVS